MAISRAGKLAAVGAVVIGYHQEGGIRVDGFALKGQVFDALGLRVNDLAFAVIFCSWVTSI
mgnify:FL=1